MLCPPEPAGALVHSDGLKSQASQVESSSQLLGFSTDVHHQLDYALTPAVLRLLHHMRVNSCSYNGHASS